MPLRTVLATLLMALTAACGQGERNVGGFSNDLAGNQIRIEALPDPRIPTVACHMAYFERSVLDRMRQGNWFEDPSNSAVTCQRTGAVDLKDVPLGRAGEEIFSQRESLFFKRVAVRRIVDLENGALLYVSHSRELIEGSAKLSIDSVPLTAAEVAAARAAR